MLGACGERRRQDEINSFFYHLKKCLCLIRKHTIIIIFRTQFFLASLFTVLPSPPTPSRCSARPPPPEPASKLQFTIINKYFLSNFGGETNELLFDRKRRPTGRGVRTWSPSPRSFRSSLPSSPNPRRLCRREAGTAVNRV